MRCPFAACIAASAFAAFAVPAQAAGDAERVRAAMQAADANIRSVQIRISSPAGMSGIGTIVRRPLKMHLRMAGGAAVVEMYVAGGYLYQRVGAGKWTKQLLPPGAGEAGLAPDLRKTLNAATKVKLGPDVTEDGVRYGDIVLTVNTARVAGAPAAPPLSVSCSYDKQTYLAHRCGNALMTYTLSRYNDPRNTVVLPAALAGAVDRGPVAVPAASH